MSDVADLLPGVPHGIEQTNPTHELCCAALGWGKEELELCKAPVILVDLLQIFETPDQCDDELNSSPNLLNSDGST